MDSGGTGLIYIYEGMLASLEGNFIERNQATAVDKDSPIIAAGAAMEEEEFGYCTEFIMSLGPDSVKKPFNEKRFTNILNSHGNSLVVVRDEDIVKVHVHTLTPGNVLNYAQQFGEFLKLKIENMTEQHHELATGALHPEDAHTDLIPEPEKEEEKEKSEYAMIAVSSGPGIDEFFKEIGVSEIVKGGQTMNPSAQDFVAAIKKANARNIYIFPNNSNIVMAASQAADMVEEQDVNVYVIPSKTILQGISASIMFNIEADPKENFEEMKSALSNVKSGEVTFAIRDSEINGVKVKKDDFIGIMEKEIISDNKDKMNVLKELLKNMIDEDSSLITLIVGEGVKEEEVEEIKQYIAETYSDLDLDVHIGGQPVYSFLVGVE